MFSMTSCLLCPGVCIKLFIIDRVSYVYGVITLFVEVFNYTLVVLERGVRKTERGVKKCARDVNCEVFQT